MHQSHQLLLERQPLHPGLRQEYLDLLQLRRGKCQTSADCCSSFSFCGREQTCVSFVG